MSTLMIICTRCTLTNHGAARFCSRCGLPLGTMLPDSGAGSDALGPYEAPDPADPDTSRLIRDLALRSGYDCASSGHGWRLVVPLPMDRHQAVYIGHAGSDSEGRAIVSLVSVCGPASDRDGRVVLKLNARSVEGHFAIKVLRGEEYFVVIQNIAAESLPTLDPAGLVRRIAEAADGLEDRLSRGRDVY